METLGGLTSGIFLAPAKDNAANRSESHASGPMPGSSKQIPSEENAPLLGDMISVENATNTLLRSIVGSGSTEWVFLNSVHGGLGLLTVCCNRFESQVIATGTGQISTGALISQFYNRPENSRSSSSDSQSSGITDYGAISKGGIGVAYKILKDGSDGNEGIAANILGSGIKLAGTALTWPFELFNLVRNSVGHDIGFQPCYWTDH